MRSGASISRAAFTSRNRSLNLILYLLIAACATTALHAQQDVPAPIANPGPYVLHLYARLVELPTMILFRQDQKKAPLQPQQINIKLDAQPMFHPTSLRLEGNDPLSIAILIDVSGDEAAQRSDLQKHFGEWVTKSLRPQDHVSIYAIDCGLIQTANDVAANSPALQKALDAALTSQQTHGTSTKGACGKSIRIRGSILFAMQKLSQLPGRRTLIVLSGGRDSKSDITWPQLNEAATVSSVTVFALSDCGPMEFDRIRNIYSLAQQSGGFLFSLSTSNVPNALSEIVSLLRTRYILQFPMPNDISPTFYHVFVTIPKLDAVIRPSGIGVPIPNAAVDHPSTDLPTAIPEPPPEPSTQPAPVPHP